MKLVRDRIPQLIEQDGLVPCTHIAQQGELWGLLMEKLVEESLELLRAEGSPEEGDPSVPVFEELADVIEVVEALKRYVDQRAPGVLDQVKREKAARKGRFSKALVLETIQTPLTESGSTRSALP